MAPIIAMTTAAMHAKTKAFIIPSPPFAPSHHEISGARQSTNVRFRGKANIVHAVSHDAPMTQSGHST
jgi:hypothetical protein